MCFSTKRPSSTFDTIRAILFIYVLSGFIISATSYSVNVSAPVFVDGQRETVVCQIDNSVLNTGNCPSSIIPIEFLEIVFTNNTITTKICVFKSFLTCTLFTQNSMANSCGCYSDGSNIYIVNVTVTADRNTFDGAIIDCKPSCFDNNNSYPFQSSYNGIPIEFVPTTTQSTTRVTGSTPFQTSTSNSPTINSTVSPSSITITAITSVTTTPPPPTPFPGWKIALIVIGIILFIVIIAIVVFLILKCKKKKQRENSTITAPGLNGTELTPNKPPAQGGNNRTELNHNKAPAQDGNNRTELIPNKPLAQDGNNRTELTVQDTEEMQDRNKHLGTDNSPAKEKRRKKKKKKKTFQEVDDESVSREEKSTVNDHKTAQKSPNDNSVSVNENYYATDNGEIRRLPIPKTVHLTSVERNSTIFQSETPRKLPPLQPKQ